MNNIQIARETMKITTDGFYNLDGQCINLPRADFSAVEVFTPSDGEKLISDRIEKNCNNKICRITVTNEDSFQAAHRFDNPFVMNFANAHHAGGGFLFGANAQEEALCRCSTLYASISSNKAGEMYRYNNTHLSRVESDYMLYSPDVAVFRNEHCHFLNTPFTAAVVTIPAPNRYGAAIGLSEAKAEEVMMRRIRIMLCIAAKYGHKNLILGAWGCGAFGNKPEYVSEYFRKVIIDEEYGKLFDEICFAVYGKADTPNYREFSKTFGV